MVVNFDQEDKILSEYLRSIGPWSKHIVISGGYALLIYRMYCSKSDSKCIPTATADIDSLIPRRLPIVSNRSIVSYLTETGFVAETKSMDDVPVVFYSKMIQGKEIEVEFLTDTQVRNFSDGITLDIVV